MYSTLKCFVISLSVVIGVIATAAGTFYVLNNGGLAFPFWGSSNKIVGEWKNGFQVYSFDSNREYIYVEGSFSWTIERSDSGAIEPVFSPMRFNNDTGKYKVSGDILTLTPDYGKEKTFTISFEAGNTMILTDESGSQTFQKK